MTKPGVWNSGQVSHTGGRDSSNWAIACYLSGCTSPGSWNLEVEPGLEPRHSDVGCGIMSDTFNHCANAHPCVRSFWLIYEESFFVGLTLGLLLCLCNMHSLCFAVFSHLVYLVPLALLLEGDSSRWALVLPGEGTRVQPTVRSASGVGC